MMFKQVFLLVSIVAAASYAITGQIHPGLKNAIDAGNVTMAKNLIEKVGVTDVYCPSSLSVKDAETIYAKILQSDSLRISSCIKKESAYNCNISDTFAFEYFKANCNGKQKNNNLICKSLYYEVVKKNNLNTDSLVFQWLQKKDGICLSKETIDNCKYLYGQMENTAIKMKVIRMLDEKKLLKYTEVIETEKGSYVEKRPKNFDINKCLREVNRGHRHRVAECNKRDRHVDLCISGAVNTTANEERFCENGGAEQVFQSKKVKEKVVMQPFEYEVLRIYDEKFSDWFKMDNEWVKDVSILKKYVDEESEITHLIDGYKNNGDFDIRQLIGNCKLSSNFDKAVRNKVGFELFSCKKILADYPISCDEQVDSIRVFGKTFNGISPLMYTCIDKKWEPVVINGKCSALRKGLVVGTYVCDSIWKHVANANLNCDDNIDSVKNFESVDSTQQSVVLGCGAGHWRELDKRESVLGVCNTSRKGKVAGLFICDTTWKTFVLEDIKGKACHSGDEIQSKYNHDLTYKCDNDSWIANVNDSQFVVDTRDGEFYGIKRFGNQIWMTENLNYNARHSLCYDNDENNCALYGRLYIWEDAAAVCLEGWHLPTQEEWKTLFSSIATEVGEENVGRAIKSASGWIEPHNGSNVSGFAALPGGSCKNSSCYYIGSEAYFLSSSESDFYGMKRAWGVRLRDDDRYGVYRDFERQEAFSVRCVKNSD